MKLLLMLGLISSLFPRVVHADRSRAGWWLGTFSKAEISSSWNGWMETQVRNNLESGRVDQLLFRTGLLYSVGEHEMGLLVGFIQTGSLLERRYSLQQGMTLTKWGNSKLTHRIRMEWRDFADNPDDALRFRYLARYSHKMDGYEAILWNEAFLNLTDESKNDQGVMERNRLFLGTQITLGTTKAEIGYMNQAILRGRENIFEHLGVMYWIF